MLAVRLSAISHSGQPWLKAVVHPSGVTAGLASQFNQKGIAMRNIALGQDIASAMGFKLFTLGDTGEGITKVEFTLEADRPVVVRVTGFVGTDEAGAVIEKVKNYTMVENDE